MPRWLHAPEFDDPEQQLRATLIHRLSLTVIVTVTPLAALLPLVETTFRYSLPLYLASLAGVALIFAVLHSGHVHAAGVLFAVLGWAVTLWASFASGGVGSPQLSMAVLVIMLTGIMWSGPAAIGMAVAISASLAGIEFLRDAALLPQPFIEATRFTVWAALTSVLALSAVLLQMFVRTMRASRDDAADKSRRLEEEMERRAETEASLHRAQKLEALGRLTGGIAHDFNNILTVLVGESEMLEESAAQGRPLSSEELGQIAEIRSSAQRAAGLTRQLLAFSRHQVGVPEKIAPDESIERLAPMLQRLIREDVALRVSPGSTGAQVRIDPGQLDQVLMNLVLNSSDAMPRGGELAIETRTVEVDDAAALLDPNAHPGEHVLISVSDSGVGIAPEDLDQIFDPFFTTKGVGRGTGLGLASAHGIVTRAGGHIRVESASEGGTTFRIYLPRAVAEPAPGADLSPAKVREGVAGTILLCEDDAAVRRITERTLANAGHTVYGVDSAEAALDWLETESTPIDLLVSDVILPGQNGVELARAAAAARPGVRVLLISGYTASVLAESGVPDEVELLEKPFKPDALLARVGALLGELATH